MSDTEASVGTGVGGGFKAGVTVGTNKGASPAFGVDVSGLSPTMSQAKTPMAMASSNREKAKYFMANLLLNLSGWDGKRAGNAQKGISGGRCRRGFENTMAVFPLIDSLAGAGSTTT